MTVAAGQDTMAKVSLDGDRFTPRALTNVKMHVLPGSGGRCEAVMNGFSFSLDVSSPTVTGQQIESLVQKIDARLP